MMKTTVNTGKALLGVFAGLSAGAVFGMLVALRSSGKKRKMTKMGEELTEVLDEMIDDRFDLMMKKIKQRRHLQNGSFTDHVSKEVNNH